MSALANRLFVGSLRGRLDNTLGMSDSEGAFKLTDAYNRLAAMIQRTGAKLVILDNVAHLFAGNENSRADVTQFVNALNRLAGETGTAIVLIGHPNKGGATYSGSTAWLNAVRSQIYLEHDTNTGLRTLTVGKANYALGGEAMRFVWDNWAFKLESEIPPDAVRALSQTMQVQAEDETFLRCLALSTDQGRNVSHQPGINYAPQIFSGMPAAKGLKPKAFKSAMERLLDRGEIEVDVELWPGSNRHKKRGIRAVTTRGSE